MTTPPTAADVDHLKMIQTNIDRMNRCSFECKKWSLGVVAAVLTVAATTRPWLAFFGVAPALVFSFLDAYYLQLERGFRNLYNKVRKGEDNDIFEMNPVKHLYPETCPQDDFWNVWLSPTVIWLHLVSLAGAFVIGMCAFCSTHC